MGRTLSASAQNVNWLLANFTDNDVFVEQTIAVSSDGLLMAVAGDRDRASSDRLSAIVSGMVSLAAGAGSSYGLGVLNKVIVDAEGGFLVVMAMGAGALLGVVADRAASLSTVAYEAALFINRTNGMLNPKLVNELKSTAAG